MGERGDFAREHILDTPMLERVRASGARVALDLGCGEGRFSRLMAGEGLDVTGVDPTRALVREASRRAQQAGPGGARFLTGRAEAIPLQEDSVDLVVAYLCLMDIEDLHAAYGEIIRVLRPGGRLLVANLSSFATAMPRDDFANGWLRQHRAAPPGAFVCEDYHATRSYWVGWRGIRVRNWHRPMQDYLAPLMRRGMTLTHFAEPVPGDGPHELVSYYRRAPMFVLMEWQKPLGGDIPGP